MEDKKMCGFMDFVMNEGKRKWEAKGEKKGRREGKEEGRREGKLEAWAETYANMKTQFDDVRIRSLLGITASQFDQVKNFCKKRFIQQEIV